MIQVICCLGDIWAQRYSRFTAPTFIPRGDIGVSWAVHLQQCASAQAPTVCPLDRIPVDTLWEGAYWLVRDLLAHLQGQILLVNCTNSHETSKNDVQVKIPVQNSTQFQVKRHVSALSGCNAVSPFLERGHVCNGCPHPPRYMPLTLPSAQVQAQPLAP
jgi:hypothetical protein